MTANDTTTRRVTTGIVLAVGLFAAASSAMLVASRQGRDVPVLARVMLLAGIGATIAANVGYGLHAGTTCALLSAVQGPKPFV